LGISTWQQKHVRDRKKMRENDKTAPASSNQAPPSGKPNNHICSNRKLENLEVSVTENGNDACLYRNKRYLRNVQFRSKQNLKTRKGIKTSNQLLLCGTHVKHENT
jgi:hypothetical protein